MLRCQLIIGRHGWKIQLVLHTASSQYQRQEQSLDFRRA